MRSTALAIVVGVLGVLAMVPPTAAAEPPTECPNPAGITLQTLMDLRDVGGPLAERFRVLNPNERGRACLGNAPFRFVAYVGRPEGLGGVISYTIEPAWLDSQLATARWLTPNDEEIEGFSTGPLLEVSVEPDVLPSFDALEKRLVLVTAQFDHPAARDCRVTGDLAPGPDRPKPAQLIEICRALLVVTDVQPIEAPCPDRPLDWQTIVGTPEQVRFLCFGQKPVTFEARGLSMTTAWDLRLPEFGADWAFLDPAAVDDATLHAFVGAPVPDPPDAPWHGTDGIGGENTLWRVTGRFGDERSDDCRPGDGVLQVPENRLVRWTRDGATAFCRNTLIVDELVYLGLAGAGSPIPSPPEATPSAVAPPSDRPSPVPSSSPAPTPAASPVTAPPAGAASSSGGVQWLIVAGIVVVLSAAFAIASATARRRSRPRAGPNP
jgi:hypothetical protein